jgi:hypothetical protein
MQFVSFLELASMSRRPLAGASWTDSAIQLPKVLKGKAMFTCTDLCASSAQSERSAIVTDRLMNVVICQTA